MVDQFNTLGRGANVPLNIGNQSEGLLVLKDAEVGQVPASDSLPDCGQTRWRARRCGMMNAEKKPVRTAGRAFEATDEA